MTTLPDFLTAKRTVEDRALNRVVFQEFADGITRRTADREADEPLRIVEIGVGTGSMIARLAEWEVLPPQVSYRAVDLDAEMLAVARRQLPNQLAAAGYRVEPTDAGLVARKTTDGQDRRLEITLAVEDGFESTDEADAVIAGAVLDLVELPAALANIKRVLTDDGLLYAPATFNGHTSFTPRDPLDSRIEGLYHRHMDEVRDQPGSSRAGQQLLAALPDAGYRVLEAGGADWVVRPADSGYPYDERVVLDFLLSTIDGALADYPSEEINPEKRTRWIDTRREQLDRGELTLVAHHMDVLAKLS